jgi:hypothetical protein
MIISLEPTADRRITMPDSSTPSPSPHASRPIKATDDRLSWPGAVSLEQRGEAIMPWRLPHDERDLFAEGLTMRAAMPAGVRLVLDSTTTAIAGNFEPDDDLTTIDLVIDGELIASQDLAGQQTFAFENLPAGPKRLELWLPQFGRFVLHHLWLDPDATVERSQLSQPRWIAYGSSITHCHEAASSSRTWPAIVAREQGYDLTCLGYGGQCHLDVSVARTIRELPADYISICAGINVYGGSTLNARTFRPALIGFLQIIREKHPEIPIAVMSPIFSPARETTENAVGFTLQAIRSEVAAAVDALTTAGDPNLHYVDGLDIFDADLADHLPDDLHPDAEGYSIMAQRYRDQVARKIFVGA